MRVPRALLLSERFPQLLAQLFDYANRPQTSESEANLLAVLDLPTAADREAILALYHQLREYIESGRNNVWQWYIANRVQPLRLTDMPASRLVGNPPWVVYNAMAVDRQDTFREHAARRNLWAGRNLATQNDLAATFVATCVDFYLQTGGKFGFVLPYAALRARQWGPFRSGDWSLRQATERGTHVDLSKDAWDCSGVNAPPFPQAQSSVIFGAKVIANRQAPNLKPLARAREQIGAGITTKMPWHEVKPLLTYTYRKEYPVAPSEAYADAFRNGATLFPQSLVVFERPESRARGVVYFRTNSAKGAWKGMERDGQVEERFVKPALFSRQLLPFGVIGNSYIVAPFAADGDSLVTGGLPQGDGAARFRLFWDHMDLQWREHSSGRPPLTLLDQVDYQGKLSSQLGNTNGWNIAYNSSGSNLSAVVVSSGTALSHTMYWLSLPDVRAMHYLAAIFNASCLNEFFRDGCRASDRHFMLLPVQNLPIPTYDAGNEHHANLAAQSQLAHERVAALVAERQGAGRRIGRNDALRDAVMQPILASIDASARAILPEYCSGPAA